MEYVMILIDIWKLITNKESLYLKYWDVITLTDRQ